MPFCSWLKYHRDVQSEVHSEIFASQIRTPIHSQSLLVHRCKHKSEEKVARCRQRILSSKRFRCHTILRRRKDFTYFQGHRQLTSDFIITKTWKCDRDHIFMVTCAHSKALPHVLCYFWTDYDACTATGLHWGQQSHTHDRMHLSSRLQHHRDAQHPRVCESRSQH